MTTSTKTNSPSSSPSHNSSLNNTPAPPPLLQRPPAPPPPGRSSATKPSPPPPRAAGVSAKAEVEMPNEFVSNGYQHDSISGHGDKFESFGTRTSMSPSIPQSLSTSTSSSSSPSPKVSSPSPLKAAADLIQKLEIAHTQVTSSAADAARECETARNNARAAQEICRRYQNRSFPKLKSNLFWGTSTGHASDVYDDIDGGDSIRDRYRHGKLSNRSTTRYGERRSTPDRSYNRHLDDKINDDHELDDQNPSTSRTTFRSPTTASDRGMTTPTPLSAGSKSTARIRGLQTPSSVDLVAQNHAEDMMELQLELEKTKQELKSERRLHEECKGELSSLQSKVTVLEDQNRSLRTELQQKQEQETSLVPRLQEELEKARSQLLQAEEDADMAVAFAAEGEKERSELAMSLERAQQEIQQLKYRIENQQRQAALGSPAGNQINGKTTSSRHVHFSDVSTASATPNHNHDDGIDADDPMGVQPMETDTPRTTPSRSMVAAGRQILFRNSRLSKSPGDVVLTMERSPAKSAERRKRLNECLVMNSHFGTMYDSKDSSNLPTPTRLTMSPARSSAVISSSTSTPGGSSMSVDDNLKKKLDEYHTAAKVLQMSGQRLRLDGVWFRNDKSTIPIHLDAMVRQYCQSAEYKIDQQDKEINKLEALCDLMEKQLL